MKESIVFYKSFYEAIKNIPQEEQLKLYNAIFDYSFTEKEPKIEDGIAKAMFILIKPNIDSANARYKASVENGKKGGRPKKETKEKPNKNLDKTQEETNENLNDNEDDNVNVDEDDNVDDNLNDNYIYISLLKKYKEKIEREPNRKIIFIGEMKREDDYTNLSQKEKESIFNELISFKDY